jgi:hypothetical protein
MGQPVAVTQTPAGVPGRVRFEINRSITGMGHERYASVAEATGEKPAAVLARSLFGTGKVTAVHVFSNIVTVDVADAANNAGLSDILRDMYQYWKPGVKPKSIDELMKMVAPSAVDTNAPVGEAGTGAVASTASKIPQLLLLRSQAALAKAKAGK